MGSSVTRSAAALIGLAAWASPGTSWPLGPLRVEAGVQAGAGTTPFGTPNPLGFGLGARAGASLANVYGGVSMRYYFGGSSVTCPTIELSTCQSIQVSVHAIVYGFEGGYDFEWLRPLTLRPRIGVGNFELFEQQQTLGAGGAVVESGATSYFYLEPGVTVLLPLGRVFVALDTGFLWLPAADGTNLSFTGQGQVGLRF
jgi:hypothetical protein